MHRFPFGTFALNPTGHKSLKPLRIAVLFPEFLGDYMMLVPFLYALKSCSDGGWVDLYTTPTVSKIARFHPSLREVVSLSDWNDSAAQSVLVAQLKGRYDAVYFTNDHLFWLAIKSKIPLKIKALTPKPNTDKVSRSYSHFSESEREEIAIGIAAGLS